MRQGRGAMTRIEGIPTCADKLRVTLILNSVVSFQSNSHDNLLFCLCKQWFRTQSCLKPSPKVVLPSFYIPKL